MSSIFAHVSYADLQLKIHSDQIGKLQQYNKLQQLPSPSSSRSSFSIPSTRDNSPESFSEYTSKLLEDLIEKTFNKLNQKSSTSKSKKQPSTSKSKKHKSTTKPITVPPMKELPITDRSYENRRGSYNVDTVKKKKKKKKKCCCKSTNLCKFKTIFKSSKIYNSSDKLYNKSENNCKCSSFTTGILDICEKMTECNNSDSDSDSDSDSNSDSNSDSDSDSYSDSESDSDSDSNSDSDSDSD